MRVNTNDQAKEVDILIGSMSTGLATGGGFVAGSSVVCTHQVCFLTKRKTKWFKGFKADAPTSESTRPLRYSQPPSPLS